MTPELLPGGRQNGREYICGSLQGGPGDSCKTNLDTGKGADFSADERWGDVIGLWAKVRNIGQGAAARELAVRYGIHLDDAPQASQAVPSPAVSSAFTPIVPVPDNAPEPLRVHPQHGQANALWRYADTEGRTLAYTARFDLPDGSKEILPLCYGSNGNGSRWQWKALPEPRPMYGLEKLAALPEAPVLLVEGEKTADAAQDYFPDHAVLTWSGGSNAVAKADLSPLYGRKVIIWPDNDEPGFKAALTLAGLLEGKADVSIIQPPDTLPEKWDLADATEPGFLPQVHIATSLPVEEFRQKAGKRYSGLAPSIQEGEDPEDMPLKEWPKFPFAACPGIVGDFVSLATRDSEADPAAVCVTMLARFAAEVYGYAEGKGPYIHVGETLHPPRLFAVICGNSSKARKGTSLAPITKLFTREFCPASEISAMKLPLPARGSGGPLSTGEGLAFQVRDESEEERERRRKMNPNEPIRDPGDKRLMIQDEEFASGLACTKREGNTLSMGLRCFWDSGDYAPLTKSNPIRVKNAHICIITHITMQELAVALADVQAFNGFGNRFLWICARRSKLIPEPSRMPVEELAPMQNELWRLVAQAQKFGLITMSAGARAQWASVYPDLSREHSGLAGSIINRAEAQTLRLALIYALLDGRNQIEERHLDAALALWRYAQESALYIFGDRSADPLEEKILEALKQGPLTATELSAVFSRNISKDRLQPLLQQLEAQQRISITKVKGTGRPKLIISMREISIINEKSENNEFDEKREALC
ncbi:MAG: DUF6371 domain-containing protein [Desulfovibrionaceae bacterium]|nr:DUF6371 domain-containing protein [Desulfovibrionaceae bacterium]